MRTILSGRCWLLLGLTAILSDTHKVYGTHVSVTKQPIGVRRLVDLHVPTNHGSEPNFYKVARHSRAVLESSSHPAPKTPTFSVFSALHDSMLGEVRISAEVYPLEVCESIDTCQLDGESGHFDIPASGRAPFDNWGVRQPQLHECFVDCKLPRSGLKLDMVHLRDAEDGLIHANMVLEEIHGGSNSTGSKKSVGLCVGPVFSAAPTFLDWVQYYADSGVDGIHMYAAVADFILSPQGGGYMHLPGSYAALSIDHHRLIQWKAFHPSPWSLHYYGQWLIYNDCLFRWRQAYEYLLFVDRDEFLHFPGKPLSEVNIAQSVAKQFQKETASVVFFGALHSVHCLNKQVPLLGFAKPQDAALVQPNLNLQVYTGYDIWDNDAHIPDFTNCSVSYHGPSAGRACHPKSLVRPLAVDLMNVHFLAGAMPGFEEAPHAVDPSVAYIKHLRCRLSPEQGTWEQNDAVPLCIPERQDFAKHTSGGVSTCPA